MLPPAELPLVPNESPPIMMLHTATDHMDLSLLLPHPPSLMRLGDTFFPTPTAYDDITISNDDYFPASSLFHCLMIDQLDPPTSVINLQ
jgi:hypothetical protein